MSKGFTQLQNDYPVFHVLNRTGVTRDIPIADGEIVQVGPNAIGKVASADLFQLPDFRLFEMKTPDMETLIKYGLIENPDAAPDTSGTVNN